MTKKKRAKIPRKVEHSKEFVKSWQRYSRAGRRDMNAAISIMQLLFADKIIPPEYLDHELSGSEWKGARELHIGGDFLLIYRIHEEKNLLTFIDLGSHSELFG